MLTAPVVGRRSFADDGGNLLLSGVPAGWRPQPRSHGDKLLLLATHAGRWRHQPPGCSTLLPLDWSL